MLISPFLWYRRAAKCAKKVGKKNKENNRSARWPCKEIEITELEEKKAEERERDFPFFEREPRSLCPCCFARELFARRQYRLEAVRVERWRHEQQSE